MFYDYYYLILVVPMIILSLVAQARVRSAFSKYSQVPTRSGQTGEAAARMVMSRNNVQGVEIEAVAGNMTDHYDPRRGTIGLSEPVIRTNSIAAVGVAAHEAGHASQYAAGYVPIRIRNAILPVARFGQPISWVLILVGLFMPAFKILIYAGIALFSAVVLFQLVTLPVEFDASRRAMATLSESGYYTEEEMKGAKKVLSAAAMTYVAAAAVFLAQLMRLLLMANRRR